MIRAIAMSIVSLLGAACGIEISDEPTSHTEQASNVHLKGGANAEPSFTDLGLALRINASVTGLGQQRIVATLSSQDALVTATCGNPGTNQWEAPGQNPAPVDVSGSVSIPRPDDKNGNLTFSVSTVAPQSPVPGAPHCPNRKWTELILDVAFTNATLIIEQPPGTVVFELSCSFSEPTTNGTVPGNEVTCSE